MTRRARVLSAILVIVVLIVIAIAAFRSAGRRLIHVDPLAKSDAIIILGSQRVDRTLEAGQLYREGWAPRVVVMRIHELNRYSALRDLGISVPLYFDTQVSILRQMGVPPNAILEVREIIDSTEGEARQIGGYARAHQYKRVIVVTSTYHTRRASRYLRCLAPNVQTIMRNTRFAGSDPDWWWQWPVDRMDVLLETIKWPKALMATWRCWR